MGRHLTPGAQGSADPGVWGAPVRGFRQALGWSVKLARFRVAGGRNDQEPLHRILGGCAGMQDMGWNRRHGGLEFGDYTARERSRAYRMWGHPSGQRRLEGTTSGASPPLRSE